VAAPILRRVFRRLSARIAVSDAARQTVQRHFAGEYAIVPNGIETEAWSAPQPKPAAFQTGRPHVLYVGRLEPRKGVEHLVAAMALLQRDVSARLVVAGDGCERERLEAAARRRGVDAAFVGRISDEHLPGYVQAADLVCSPALGGESFGIVLLEAIAAGTPVVASSIAGYRDLIHATGGGRLVAPADPRALAEAIGELLGDTAARAGLSQAGRRAAVDYDWALLAERLERIYRTVLC
jgi:phosphatidylinositol alpha-mannosyltransferase